MIREWRFHEKKKMKIFMKIYFHENHENKFGYGKTYHDFVYILNGGWLRIYFKNGVWFCIYFKLWMSEGVSAFTTLINFFFKYHEV